MDDRGRILFGYFAAYLHFSRDSRNSASGLTPTNIQTLCKKFEICSPGRAAVMLSLMRFAGYLAPDTAVTDRRHRRLVATEKLFALLIERWRLHFTAMAPLLPDGKIICKALDDPAFVRAFINAMFVRFRPGFRFGLPVGELRLFGERNAGILILASIISAGAEDDTVPPSRPVPISIAALGRRFFVSRAHVLKLFREAETIGFIVRSGPDGNEVLIRPDLAGELQEFFADMFQFFADSARAALGEMSIPAL
jgi:hypothetical protein